MTRRHGARGRLPNPPSGVRTHLFLAVPVLAAVAGVALFLQREWTIAGLWGFSLDDSWIHAVFARNLATGNGYAFNPGEPVSGSTGPLYSALLALVYAVTGDMTWSAKGIGIACHLFAVIQVYRAARHLDPTAAWMSPVAAALVALSPPLLWAAVSGMEISLYLALVCWGIERYVAGRDLAATLLWSLGVWVRPDGAFLVALSLIGPSKSLWKRAATAGAVLVPFFAFNAALGGSIFPQTVGAKTHVAIDPTGRTWTLFREWTAMWGVPFRAGDQLEHPVPLLLLLLVGAVVTARSRPVLALYALGFPIAFSLFAGSSGSHKRYMMHVIPFGMLLAVAGLHWIATRTAGRRVTQAALAASAVCLVWQAAVAEKMASIHGWNVQNINQMQRLFGVTTRSATVPDAVVAASDIGAIGYFSHRRVIDLMGLVSRSRSLPENLSIYKPDVLIVFVDWFKIYARRDPATGFYAFWDSDSTHKYTLLAAIELRHNTICGGDQMIAFVRQNPGDPPPQLSFQRF